MRRIKTGFIAGVAMLWMCGTAVMGYDLPAVNLGFTSFLDGIPPAGPGWYVANYLQYYQSDSFKDADGKTLPFPDPELKAWINLLQVMYLSEAKCPLTGGAIGLDVILPYADIDVDYGAAGPFPVAGDSGFGDLLVGPFLQWVKMGEQGPVFAHRVELQCIFPTGEYDSDAQINPGANVFSFNPYWAGTWFCAPSAEVSARIHYLWNASNDDPAPRPGGAPDKVQAGQAVHANFSVSYQVLEPLRLGVNGYYLKQIEKTKVDGVSEAGSEEQVLGLGAGALYSFSRDTHLFFNMYVETAAENRPEGERYNVRLVHHF